MGRRTSIARHWATASRLRRRHSGMAEVTDTLASALPDKVRPLLSFEIGPGAVE